MEEGGGEGKAQPKRCLPGLLLGRQRIGKELQVVEWGEEGKSVPKGKNRREK